MSPGKGFSAQIQRAAEAQASREREPIFNELVVTKSHTSTTTVLDDIPPPYSTATSVPQSYNMFEINRSENCDLETAVDSATTTFSHNSNPLPSPTPHFPSPHSPLP
jgi:hypothetical protein